MALDTFTKSGVATYTFTKGNTFPINHSYTPNQVSNISGGGTSKLMIIGDPQEFWGITLKNIQDSDLDLLYAFLNDTLINWGEQLFTWTDRSVSPSAVRSVRLWSDNFQISKIGADLNSVNLTLKIET